MHNYTLFKGNFLDCPKGWCQNIIRENTLRILFNHLLVRSNVYIPYKVDIIES